MSQDSGHTDPKKGSAGKDKAQSRRNPHIHVELPNVKADQDRESHIQQDLLSRLAQRDGRRQASVQYGADTMAVMIALRRDGLLIKDICAKRHIGKVSIPSEDGYYAMCRVNPEFKESMDRARKERERHITEDGIEQIPRISRVPGLRRANKSRALAEHARVALSLGRAALPDSYGGEVQDREVIVMEVAGGWDPGAATAVPGETDGQGSEAEAARLRWQEIRERGEDNDILRTAYAGMDTGGSGEVEKGSGKSQQARKTGKAAEALRPKDGLRVRAGKRKTKGAGEAPA